MCALPRLVEDQTLPARLLPMLICAREQWRLLDERIERCGSEIRPFCANWMSGWPAKWVLKP